MTNYDKNKNMSIEEMSRFLEKAFCDCCECCVLNSSLDCGYYEIKDENERIDFCCANIKKWLESEANDI